MVLSVVRKWAGDFPIFHTKFLRKWGCGLSTSWKKIGELENGSSPRPTNKLLKLWTSSNPDWDDRAKRDEIALVHPMNTRHLHRRWWARPSYDTRRFMVLWVIPIGSMYGIFTYIWLILLVNVGKYIIHGSLGIGFFGVNRDWSRTSSVYMDCWLLSWRTSLPLVLVSSWIRPWILKIQFEQVKINMKSTRWAQKPVIYKWSEMGITL